ncbi:hypothetical protein ScPMuIL_007066 [Solemya velum]
MFLEDLSRQLQAVGKGARIGEITLNHLLYADDLVLIAENAKDLQLFIDTMHSGCGINKMEINPAKFFATQCDCPIEIPNANIEYTELYSGAKAKYTCAVGYSASDSFAEIECLEDSRWSLVSFECKACDEPPELANAVTGAGTTTIGSVRHYTCSDGWGMYGSGTVTCQSDTSWSSLDSECFELMNVALKREASISSVFESDYTEAWRAVDGSLDVQHPYCAHTADGDTEPWLLIDLGQTAVILTVKILNRDMCVDRVSNLNIAVGENRE